MLFPKKRNTIAKGPKWVEMLQQTWPKWVGEFVCWELFTVSKWTFYCIQMNPLCKFYTDSFGKNYQVDTDALNKYVVQYRQRRSWSKSTSFVNEMFHKLAYQQM